MRYDHQGGAIALTPLVPVEDYALEMQRVSRGQFTPRTDIRFVPDGRGGVILQGRLVQ